MKKSFIISGVFLLLLLTPLFFLEAAAIEKIQVSNPAQSIYGNRGNLTGAFSAPPGYGRHPNIYRQMYPQGYATRYLSPYAKNTYYSPYHPYSSYFNNQGIFGDFQNSRLMRAVNRFRINRLSKLSDQFKNIGNKKNKPKGGTVTGYSPQVDEEDIYKQLGIYDPNDKKQRANSPNCTMDLFQTPNTNGNYNRSNSKTDSGGAGAVGRTGVTIIYD